MSPPTIYRCPAGELLTYRYTNEEVGKMLRRYWTTACQTCALKPQCTTGKERRISRREHEAVLETVQDRLDRNPDKMRVRRQTVEHPFGTIKAWMGATHFQGSLGSILKIPPRRPAKSSPVSPPTQSAPQSSALLHSLDPQPTSR
jgi:Transposase DDE domain